MRRLAIFSLSAAMGCGFSGVAAGQQERPDAAARPLFDRLDQNKDGQVAADEITEERKSYFERLLREGDKNNDGKLSRDEFQAAAQQGRRRPDAPESNEQRPRQTERNVDPSAIFRTLDKNADGKVTPDEVPEERRQRFQAGLSRSDKDGDGGLNLDEFKASMAAMAGRAPDAAPPGQPGMPPRPNIAAAPFFRAIDTDRDGKLSSDELAKAGDALKTLDRNGDGSLTPEELVPPGAAGQAGRPETGRPPQQGNPGVAAFLERLKQADANGDGKLSKDEAPERMKENFDRIDANSDGQLDQEELRRMASRIRPNQQDNPPGRPGNRERDKDK